MLPIRYLLKKKEQPSAIIGKDKTLKTTTEEIREEFRQFYSELFTQESITNQISERLVNTRINKIEKLARKNRQREKHNTEIFKDEVEDHIRKTKNKTTIDLQGTNNIIIKNGGKDLTESLTKLFTEINTQQEQPDQWTEMMINSVYKIKQG